MTIICGTDLSSQAGAALQAALALAERFADTDLWVVHVLEPQVTDALAGFEVEELKARVARQLDVELRAACPVELLPHVHTHIIFGAAAESLADLASEKRATVLVVASQGYSSSPVFRLGGTSERVTLLSHVPVLVVRDPAPLTAWSAKQHALKVVVALDFTESSDAAVRFAQRLLQAGDCSVTFGYVYDHHELARRYGKVPAAEHAHANPEGLLQRDLATRVGDLAEQSNVTFLPMLGVGRTGDHLLRIVEREHADLLLVGIRRQGAAHRLVSVTGVALHFAQVSTICAPVEARAAVPAHPIRRVLVSTDLSGFANHAVTHGYELLLAAGGEVHLLHVVDPQSATLSGGDASLHAQLRALVPTWAAQHGIDTITEVVHRKDVARSVVTTAARLASDVICMASHGRSAVAQSVLGSVSAEVVRESHLPVLIIRPPAS